MIHGPTISASPDSVTVVATATVPTALRERLAARNEAVPAATSAAPTRSRRPDIDPVEGASPTVGEERNGNRGWRPRPPRSARTQMTADPKAATATGQTSESPNHSPSDRSTSRAPSDTRKAPTVRWTPPLARAGSADSGSSRLKANSTRYSAMPAPPASESTTNARRTNTESTPRRSASPPATPASTRSRGLRTNRDRREPDSLPGHSPFRGGPSGATPGSLRVLVLVSSRPDGGGAPVPRAMVAHGPGGRHREEP